MRSFCARELVHERVVIFVRRVVFDDDFFVVIRELVDNVFYFFAEFELVVLCDTVGRDGHPGRKEGRMSDKRLSERLINGRAMGIDTGFDEMGVFTLIGSVLKSIILNEGAILQKRPTMFATFHGKRYVGGDLLWEDKESRVMAMSAQETKKSAHDQSPARQ